MLRSPLKIKWYEGAPAPECHAANTAVFLNGRVYIGGGESWHLRPLYQIDVYNVAKNLWTISITTQSAYFALATLNNNLIIAGGRDRNSTAIKQIFTLDNNQLRMFNTMSKSRYCATAEGYRGILLIVGGKSQSGNVVASTELFDSTNGQCYICDDLPQPHYWMQSTVVGNTFYLLGGFDGDACYSPKVFTANVDTLSNHQLKWSSESPTPWCRSAPATLFSTNLLTIGGVVYSDGCTCTSNIYIFDKTNHRWNVIGYTPSGTDAPSATNIANDKVIVIGGVTYGAGSVCYTNTVWIGLIA